MGGELDRRQQILDAAFEEFAAKGFSGATIKSIAARAELASPALIYWYFPGGKEELFYAAGESKVSFLAVLEHTEQLMDRPPEEVLPAIASAYLGFASQPTARRLLLLMLAEAPRRPQLLGPVIERGPLRVLSFLSEYMARQVELGRLRPHDPRSSARAFIGMLIPQGAAHVLLPQLADAGPTDDEHISTALRIFLEGLQADGEEAADGSG